MNIINNHFNVIGEIDFKNEEELMLFLRNNKYAIEITKKHITMFKRLKIDYKITTYRTWTDELKDDNNGSLYYCEFDGYILEI
jgi:hypothetical protein